MAALCGLVVVATLLGPAERTLGATARIIYLHGALVWTAIMAFGAAALLGLAGLLVTVGLLPKWGWLHDWSRAAGRVALIFWIGYLPLSMWSARAAWGTIFLEDPSFQNAFRVLAVALIVQVVIWLRPRPAWVPDLLNLIPFAFIVLQLSQTQRFMHPDSPIGDSESTLIQLYFYLLSGLCGLLALAVGRCLLRLDPAKSES